MTSGIPNFTQTIRFKKLIQSQPTAYHSPTFFVDMAYEEKDEFTPGKAWSYSNTNYYLLGILIEKVTHHTLAEEFNQRFFKPLHLNHSYYSASNYSTKVQNQKAHPYFNNQDMNDVNPSYYGPAGSMLMNTTDLVIWTQALFTPGKILSQASINQLMTTVPVPRTPPRPAGSRYGLGIFSLEIPGYGLTWWYTGVVDGYSSLFMWIPGRKIILTAQINGWGGNNFALLMPGQVFTNTLLQKIQKPS